MFFTTNKIWKSGRESGWEDNGWNAVHDNGGFGMAQMMWQCWVQAKSDIIYTFKDQGTIGNFSVQNLGGLRVQSVQMGTRQGPSHPRSQIALPEMQILLQIGKRESGFQHEIDGGTYLS